MAEDRINTLVLISIQLEDLSEDQLQRVQGYLFTRRMEAKPDMEMEIPKDRFFVRGMCDALWIDFDILKSVLGKQFGKISYNQLLEVKKCVQKALQSTKNN